MRQMTLFSKSPTFHGGELNAGRRKGARPLARKRPLHLVLKSSRASLRKHEALILASARRYGERFGIRLYDQAVNHDHLHFVLKIPGRREYAQFIRALTGFLARKLGKGLWKVLPFTRIASWGRDFQRLKAYLCQNREEASGRQPYTPREDYYARLRKSETRRQA